MLDSRVTMFGMAGSDVHIPRIEEVGRGRSAMRGGRSVSFTIQYHHRYGKQLRFLVSYEDRDLKHRCLREWFRDEGAALAAARVSFRPVRGGFTYTPSKDFKR